ncbi:hypothetical protein Ciccas_013255 [Cichlidogyrus casuarinus]|uniref:Uncharacterized protein n=1 Tax=Cichlidogyrus casuarinus TaxID=1844966 RepID=A0ABD2PND7_9PLAT
MTDSGICSADTNRDNILAAIYRGWVSYVNVEFWGTNKNGSAYYRNKDILDPIMPTVAVKAMTDRRSHILTQDELVRAREESSWSRRNEQAPDL